MSKATVEISAIDAALLRCEDTDLPAFPIVPEQDAEKYPSKDSQGKIRKNKDGTNKPKFNGKNPSYFDASGEPQTIDDWQTYRTFEESKIFHHHFQDSRHGIGAGFGHNDIYCLDSDVKDFRIDKNKHDEWAQAKHDEWLKKTGLEEISWVEQSTSGGKHCIFKLSKNPGFKLFYGDVDGKRKNLGECLGGKKPDCKTSGISFCVMAPSATVPAGNPYKLVTYREPGLVTDLSARGIYGSSQESTEKPVKTETTPLSELLEDEDEVKIVPLDEIISETSQKILRGENVKNDRSASLAAFLKDLHGWKNQLEQKNIVYTGDVNHLASVAAKNLGMETDRLERIKAGLEAQLATAKPSCVYAGGKNAIWVHLAKFGIVDPEGVPYTISDKGKIVLPKPSKVAAYFIEKYKGELFFDETTWDFWQYAFEKPGLWSKLTPNTIRQIVQTELFNSPVWADQFDDTFVNKVCKIWEVERTETKRNWQENKGLIPLANCVLNAETREILEHDPKYRFRWQLPYDYNPEITCEPILNWLMWSLDNDTGVIDVLRAFWRCLITGSEGLQIFLEVIGEGGTGKSVLNALTRAFVGNENCLATKLVDMESRPFALGDLPGKRLIAVSEVDKYAGAASTLKAITAGDPVAIEVKHKQATSFSYPGMVLLVGNTTPKWDAGDSGIMRRRRTLCFSKKVDVKDQKLLLEYKGDELIGEFVPFIPGLLNWVLDMPYSEALEILRVTSKNTLLRNNGSVLNQNNDIWLWAEECCEFTTDLDQFEFVGQKVKRAFGSPSWEGEYENSYTHLFPSFLNYAAQMNFEKWTKKESEFKKALIAIGKENGHTLIADRSTRGDFKGRAIIRGIRLKPKNPTDTVLTETAKMANKAATN